MLFQQIAKEMAKGMLSDDMKIKVRNVAAKYRNREMLQKHAQTQPYQEGAYPTGINLIGDISAETGLFIGMRMSRTGTEYEDIGIYNGKWQYPFLCKTSEFAWTVRA